MRRTRKRTTRVCFPSWGCSCFLWHSQASRPPVAQAPARRLKQTPIPPFTMTHCTGVGFMMLGERDAVAVIGRRSARAVGRTWDSSRSWTVDQLGFLRRWQYGLQLYDLYSAVRRGQWPSSSPGAPRRATGRRVMLREVHTGGYVRVMTRREADACRQATGWRGSWDGLVEPLEGELFVGGQVPWLHGGTFELYDASEANGARKGNANITLAGTAQLREQPDRHAQWELLSRVEDAQGFVAVGWRTVFLEKIGTVLGQNQSFEW
eukprot:scaffold55797_cov31-Tisochrysis_lutea.AAC.1